MFFAISGFLITMLLVREFDRSGTISMKGFYWRRSLRILPAYVAFLLVVFVLTRIGTVAMSPSDWAAALTYTVNFVREPSWAVGHVWSLSVEEQFYLVWPLLVMMLSPARARVVVLGYLIGAFVTRVVIWAFFPHQIHLIEDLTPLRLDAIATGCLLALLASEARFRTVMTRVASFVPALAVLAMVALAVSYAASQRITAYGVTLSYSFEACCMALIIWSMANSPQTRLGRVLETRPFVIVGLLSYSLYLWQQLFMIRDGHSILTMFPLNVLLAGLVAAVSYYVIELPFLRIKDRKPASAPTIAPAPAPAVAPSAAPAQVREAEIV